MAALDFPSSPTNGQEYTQNGIKYYYDATSSGWLTTYVTNLSYANVLSNQVVFVNGGVATGSNGLLFTANTLYVSNITASQTSFISNGFSVVTFNAGANVAAYGTWRPDPSNGNYQFANSNGSLTIASPNTDCAIDILLYNGLGLSGNGARSITFSGFTAPATGGSSDPYDTTANSRFLLFIRRMNGVSTYAWKALQ